MRNYILSILFLSISYSYSQNTDRWNSSKIFNEIEKLNFLGSVVYLAAHPDDENTNLIAYLSNKEKAYTSYISLTRGDGGQNLIGSELREALGLIRLQELLEARKVDGGNQYFTRANDFGFSKNPKETLQIWDKNQVLYDLTYLIRYLKPDVVITRFDYRTPGTTHGHHTSSALLMQDVFKNAHLKTFFPEQLKKLTPWQPKNLFLNISPFFYKTNKDFINAPKNNFLTVKTGNYYPNLGLSNSEIAAWSRSKHRSQGFGTLTKRGEFNEYLEPLITKKQKVTSIFDGVDTSWGRIKNTETIQKKLNSIISTFDFNAPENSIKKLVELYELIENIDDVFWKEIKLLDLKNIIFSCAGIYTDFYTIETTAIPGEKINLFCEVIAQNSDNIKIKSLIYLPTNQELIKNKQLIKNVDENEIFEIEIPKTTNYTTPQWINNHATNAMYFYNTDSWLETPDVIRDQKVSIEFLISGKSFSLKSNIISKTNDPSIGELRKNLNIIPPLSLSFEKDHIIKKDFNKFKILVNVHAQKKIKNTSVSLKENSNYNVFPKQHTISEINKNQIKEVEFYIEPKNSGRFEILAQAKFEDQIYNQQLNNISYPHIKNHILLNDAKSNLHVVNLYTNLKKIGYVLGAGDDVWKGIEEMGYDLEIINQKNLNYNNLKKYNCIILGIRAYNVVNELETNHTDLMKFVENGGTLIAQYNTTTQLNFKDFAPYPITISSNRVTDENAKVSFIEPNHPVLNYPNKITANDFKDWVQEQGLYYPIKWDARYKAILQSNDPEGIPEKGSLLVTKYGKGHYIYTGLSFFRQIPNGVTGAYKLLSNLIEIKDFDETE